MKRSTLRFIGSNTLTFLIGLLIMFLTIRFKLNKTCSNPECPDCPTCQECQSNVDFAKDRGKRFENSEWGNYSVILQNMYNDANVGYWPDMTNIKDIQTIYGIATRYTPRFSLRSGGNDPMRPFVASF